MKKNLLFLGLCIFIHLSISSQAPKLEEVYAQLDTIQSSQKYCASALNEGNKFRRYNQIEEALRLFSSALSVAQADSLPEYEIASFYEIANAMDMKGETQEAVRVLRKALKKLEGEGYSKAGEIYKTMGRFSKKEGALDSAVHYLAKAEDWYKGQKPETQYYLWSVYDHWHGLYLKFGDLKRAEEYLLRAFDLVNAGEKKTDKAYLLSKLRSLYLQMGDAEKYAKFNKAYYTLMSGTSKRTLSHGLDPPQAFSLREQIDFFNRLLTENKRLDFIEPNFQIQQKVAKLNLEAGNFKQALKMLDGMNTSLGGKADSIAILEIYEMAYSGTGQSDKAILTLKEILRLKELLYKEKEQKELLELEKKYKTAQKDQEIALAQIRQEAQEAELQRALNQRNSYIMAALFLVLLLGLAVYLAIQNRKQNQLLEIKNNQIQQALDDKEILLREIHHRVKNNLQVVSSLLNLQSQYISDEEALKAIIEGKNRVSSVALIHQSLYQENGLTSIDTHEYFSNLIESLLDSYQVDHGHIELTKKIDNLQLDVETMIPLGLIANELISNVLKHAFKQKNKQNRLQFGLWEEDGQLLLEIKDNGVGMNSDDFLLSPNFGNKLIQAFQKKLQAQIKIVNEEGSRITLKIANYKKAA